MKHLKTQMLNLKLKYNMKNKILLRTRYFIYTLLYSAMGSLSSLFTKKQGKNMNEKPEKQQDTENHILDKLSVGVVSSRFTITYCVDGNLGTVQSWECIAESKEIAEYDFWDRHNSLYTDILSLEENGC